MPKLKPKKKVLFFAGCYFGLFLLIVIGSLLVFKPVVYRAASLSGNNKLTASSTGPVVVPEVVAHLTTPKPVKALYMTACYASAPTLRKKIIDLAVKTEINAVVLNIKDETGGISFKSDNPILKSATGIGCSVADMKGLIKEMHQKGIYVIGRVAVFQDPHFVKIHPELAVKRASDGGVWRDRKGISWLDVKATPVWDYVSLIAHEAYFTYGFDEINFDYIRFPSDGNMQDIAYPFYRAQTETKAQALKDFFIYLDNKTKDIPGPMSVDLFGMTTTNKDDLGIGQTLENALPYFDYVAPMVYPSHWPNGWNGFKKPATVPYEVIKISMASAVAKAKVASTSPSKLRPWLQDFDLGADYTAPMIRAQIQATYDVGLDSWMVWDPKNIYTAGAYNPI